jgi:arylsulfatase A-like enzyme
MKVLLLKLLSVLLVALFSVGVSSAAERPNVVVILVDDLGYSDLGCFGSEIATPNIDRLAKGGVAWTQFYNQARCCPTRAALLTGRYPHQVGIGEMIDQYAAEARAAANSPAYQDHLSTNSPTVAEVLREAGYRTMMSGKWHLGRRPEEWPVRRGFDRSFVQVDGAMNYFGGDAKGSPRARMAIDGEVYTPPMDGFFTTDAFTEKAIEFLKEARTNEASKPFFLYMAYNAPHWPLQAHEEDIAKFAGKYDAGWQAIREARLKRMIELGVVPKGQEMAPMDRGQAKPWAELTEERRKEWARRMEVYAAQVAGLDRAVGRLLEELKRLDVERNTVVVFLSDNGGAAEDPNKGEKGAVIGSRESFRGYGRPWATVSNTPWRRHKVSGYEGGISTPLLVRWPAGLDAGKSGGFIREPGHVIDLMPTILELAEAKYTAGAKGKLEGESLVGMITGKGEGKGASGVSEAKSTRIFCWEHEGNRAIRKGNWKLVALPSAAKGEWELYDIGSDRVESRDLAKSRPEVVRELASEYERWAERCGVIDFGRLKGSSK